MNKKDLNKPPPPPEQWQVNFDAAKNSHAKCEVLIDLVVYEYLSDKQRPTS